MDKVRVIVRDRVGVRVGDGVAHFTFCHISSTLQKPISPQARILPIAAEHTLPGHR